MEADGLLTSEQGVVDGRTRRSTGPPRQAIRRRFTW
ncbi:hypothetical protein [Streptomyces mexicanus]